MVIDFYLLSVYFQFQTIVLVLCVATSEIYKVMKKKGFPEICVDIFISTMLTL